MFLQLKEILHRCVEDPQAENQLMSWSNQMTQLSGDEVKSLLQLLVEFAQVADDQSWPRLVAPCLVGLSGPTSQALSNLKVDWLQDLETLYRDCPPDQALRNQILALLADADDQSSLQMWVRLVCDDPPTDRGTIGLAFAPRMRENRKPPAWLLEQLMAGATKHVSVAAAVFDFLNYHVQTHRIHPHPAEERATELRTLLGELVGQMSKIEEGNLPVDAEATRIARIIGDSTALIVSLCNSFAIMQDQQSIGKLKQAVQLRHRRIRTEAAAALAALGDPDGEQILIQLAEEPVSRLRVVAYARELGIENQISLEHRGEIATAESHLAIWLAESAQMGMAPSSMQLLDHRELNWPSYEQPQSCFLFRFFYGSHSDAYSNIGINGPLTHAFSSDLSHLSLADMYAAFAGWQTVHPEIFVVPLDRAEKILAAETRRLVAALAQTDFVPHHPLAVSGFFGQYAVVARSQRENETGIVILDQDNAEWIASGSTSMPIDWQMALDIWRGRKLLANFNPDQRF